MINYVARKIVLIGVIGLFAVIIYYIVAPNVSFFKHNSLEKRLLIETTSADKKPLSIDIGTTTLMVDLAVSEDEKIRGLSGQTFLDENKGMLFIFNTPSYPALWMKNMLFSIDIAWLDSNFNIVDIKKGVSPNTYPQSFQPVNPAKYVLEVNSGFFDSHNISVGSIVTLSDNNSPL
ncbi:MAG: DUF192 domain-containing protein [Candidatus Paceibacterota bacterium]|jgi:hypothetical protein